MGGLRATEGEATAPNLRRCAIISCPLHGPDGNGGYTRPVHDELNRKLNAAIQLAIDFADAKGFIDSGKNTPQCEKLFEDFLSKQQQQQQQQSQAYPAA